MTSFRHFWGENRACMTSCKQLLVADTQNMTSCKLYSMPQGHVPPTFVVGAMALAAACRMAVAILKAFPKGGLLVLGITG